MTLDNAIKIYDLSALFSLIYCRLEFEGMWTHDEAFLFLWLAFINNMNVHLQTLSSYVNRLPLERKPGS